MFFYTLRPVRRSLPTKLSPPDDELRRCYRFVTKMLFPEHCLRIDRPRVHNNHLVGRIDQRLTDRRKYVMNTIVYAVGNLSRTGQRLPQHAVGNGRLFLAIAGTPISRRASHAHEVLNDALLPLHDARILHGERRSARELAHGSLTVRDLIASTIRQQRANLHNDGFCQLQVFERSWEIPILALMYPPE